MQVRIVLDQPHGHFTNLDVITGRVILQVPNAGTISHITVKLEGESRTRLMAPPPPGPHSQNQRPRPAIEVHKLLYRVQKVFPPENSPVTPDPNPAFLLQYGTYSYPFQFKIPFNNSCNAQNTATSDLKFAGLSLEVQRAPTHHVKATLPPNLYFVGEADIRYYVKVTVGRPSLLKQNPRAYSNFNFVPIEPPRAVADGEVYARRQHQFIHAPPLPERKGSTFGAIVRRKSSVPSSPVTSNNQPLPPARFSVDARIPNPAILTCGQDIPLKVLVKQLSEKSEPLYLQTLQIELVGHTRVRAHDTVRVESNGWVIISLSNINQPIGEIGDAVGTETDLSKEFWFDHPLPNTVAPSFTTCNIARSYELVVSIGLVYGSAKSAQNQFIVLPLRINLEVYSGITPPADLIKRMEATPTHPLGPQATYKPPINSQANPSMYPGPSQSSSQLPPQSVPGSDDAPPSYEDAIASELPPLIGPRPVYHPPPAPEGESRLGSNEKTGLH